MTNFCLQVLLGLVLKVSAFEMGNTGWLCCLPPSRTSINAALSKQSSLHQGSHLCKCFLGSLPVSQGFPETGMHWWMQGEWPLPPSMILEHDHPYCPRITYTNTSMFYKYRVWSIWVWSMQNCLSASTVAPVMGYIGSRANELERFCSQIKWGNCSKFMPM